MGNCLPILFGATHRNTDENPINGNRASSDEEEGIMSFDNPVMMPQNSAYMNQLYQNHIRRHRQQQIQDQEEAKKMRIRFLLNQIPADVFPQNMKPVECAICMLDFEPGQLIRFLPCMHSFHQLCVDEWLMISFTCPSCQIPVENTIMSSLYDYEDYAIATSSKPQTEGEQTEEQQSSSMTA